MRIARYKSLSVPGENLGAHQRASVEIHRIGYSNHTARRVCPAWVVDRPVELRCLERGGSGSRSSPTCRGYSLTRPLYGTSRGLRLRRP